MSYFINTFLEVCRQSGFNPGLKTQMNFGSNPTQTTTSDIYPNFEILEMKPSDYIIQAKYDGRVIFHQSIKQKDYKVFNLYKPARELLNSLKAALDQQKTQANRFSKEIWAQKSSLEEWHDIFVKSANELVDHLIKKGIKFQINQDSMGINLLANEGVEITKVNLIDYDLTVIYKLSYKPHFEPVVSMRFVGGLTRGDSIDTIMKVDPPRLVDAVFDHLFQNIPTTESIPSNFEQQVLKDLEQINKNSTSDEKLDMWGKIQQVTDSRSKEMLEQKFKSKMASRLRKRINYIH
jgi:hypothetical protein